MYRSSVPHSVDQRIFKSTADRIKSINIRPMTMRGGIRL